MSHVIYVIGYPGSGKTTMVRNALNLLGREVFVPSGYPVPHERHGDVWWLGVDRAPFGGTDALSMSIQPKAIAMLADLRERGDCRILLGEGDRLANAAYFGAIRQEGHTLTVLHLDIHPDEARTRATTRARTLGNEPQSETWWRGRVTKTDNLANSRRVHRLDATQTPNQLGTYLHSLIA